MSDPFVQLSEMMQPPIPAQMLWATVKEVDWGNREMTATGLTDDLDYYHVGLGLGSYAVKPKQGSKVLLAVIEGQAQHTILVFADEIEEEQLISGQTEINVSVSGIKIERNGENLYQVLSDMIDELNKIVVIQGNTINVGAMNQIKQRLNGVLI